MEATKQAFAKASILCRGTVPIDNAAKETPDRRTCPAVLKKEAQESRGIVSARLIRDMSRIVKVGMEPAPNLKANTNPRIPV